MVVPGLARQGTAAPSAVEAAVSAELLELNRAGIVRYVSLSKRNGRASTVYGDLGPCSPLNKATAVDGADALDYINRHAALVGVADAPAELQLARSFETAMGHHFVFAQRLGEYPVFGGEVDVHVGRGGGVFGLTSTVAVGLDKVETNVSIDQWTATAAAVASREGSVAGDRAPELGIIDTDAGARLAWRVEVSKSSPTEAWEIFVDAVTGAVLETRSLLRHATAKVFVPNAVVAANQTSLTDSGDSNAAVPESAYTTVTLQGLDSSGLVTGPYCATTLTTIRVNAPSGDFTFLRRSDEGFEEVMSYWAIDTAQRYIQGLGINNAAAYQIPVDAHEGPADNSFYRRNGNGTGTLNFGDGGVDDGEDGEIVWHEYGHAVLDNQRPNISTDEGGAIHEGWGDYLAASLAMTVTGDSRFYPFIGEWDAVSYNPGNPAFLRRVDLNKRYPDDLVGEEHSDGEIWSACLYDLNQAIGRNTADRIIVNSHFLFSSSVGFESGAAAVLEADAQLNGGANATAIITALGSHGIGLSTGTPVVTSVKYKTTSDGTKKLVVDGADFVTFSAQIEVNGTALGSMKYPGKHRLNNGTSTRIASIDSRIPSLVPSGVTVQITVFNPSTGARSAPFSFTR
jgi:Zn-dependent metalloprotease